MDSPIILGLVFVLFNCFLKFLSDYDLKGIGGTGIDSLYEINYDK